MTTRQIADAVGCDTPYVRVVVRQRKGGSTSEIDLRYRSGKGAAVIRANVRHRYHNDPDFRERADARTRKWRSENRERHNAYNRQHYRKMKAQKSTGHEHST